MIKLCRIGLKEVETIIGCYFQVSHMICPQPIVEQPGFLILFHRKVYLIFPKYN